MSESNNPYLCRKIDETDETPSQCDRSLTSYPSEGTEDVTFPLITVTINPLEQNEVQF